MPEKINNEELVAHYKKLKRDNDNYGAEQVLKKIIDNNEGIIKNRIRKFTIYRENLNSDDKDDLRGVSLDALWQATEEYNEASNTSFTTYAVWKIDSKIQDWLRDNHIIQIPNRVQSLCSQYYGIIEQYKKDNKGECPTDEYIKKMMGIGDAKYQSIKDALAAYHIERVYTSEEDDDKGKDENNMEQIPAESDLHMEIIIKQSQERIARAILKLRNENERKVILRFFYQEKKLKDIAKELGVTEQRVSAIKKKAIEHLRQMPEIRNIATEMEISYR